ncbi:ABC transporter permease subunit [Actinomadura flavalba]|uniref:ABC transporter permease subunit n=1 Tax=Actinomadura flavalba TaxID=1120938 RepID=UPI00036E1EBF|nr:ABC transporter permease subunit [Actinomadura flavalba]
MIWLAWRQFRVHAALTAGALAALALYVALTGPGLADAYARGSAGCGGEEACVRFAQTFFLDHQLSFTALSVLVLVLPGVIGLFWGAPLISRELEAGTHRLVWNQSVTRGRWLATRLSLGGVAAALTSGLAVALVSWWSEPLQRAAPQHARMEPLLFGVRGVVPFAYALLAFLLGVAVGTVLRRPLPAMAVTLAVFTAVQIAVPLVVRPHLLPSTTVEARFTPGNLRGIFSEGPGEPVQLEMSKPAGAWTLAEQTIDGSGTVVKGVDVSLDEGPCAPQGSPPAPSAQCFEMIDRLGYRQRTTYLTADRFWPLQGIETGLYLLVSAGLAGFTFFWLRRRIS